MSKVKCKSKLLLWKYFAVIVLFYILLSYCWRIRMLNLVQILQCHDKYYLALHIYIVVLESVLNTILQSQWIGTRSKVKFACIEVNRTPGMAAP